MQSDAKMLTAFHVVAGRFTMKIVLLLVAFVLSVPAVTSQGQEKQVQAEQPAQPEQKKEELAPGPNVQILPLQKLIQKVLGQKNPGVPVPAEKDEVADDVAAEGEKKRDLIDQRVPIVREEDSLLKSAKTRIDRGQWPEAIEILQNILDEGAESVVIGQDGDFHSIRWETHLTIGNLPTEARRLYENTYGKLAQRLLDEAVRNFDTEAIRRVAEQYFHTKAGYDAANRVAGFHLDLGEFAMAARWYRRLEGTSAEYVSNPLWRFKVRETYRQAAFTEDDLNTWLALSDEQTLELASQLPNQNPAETLDQWSNLVMGYQRPLENWLFPGGSRTRNGQVQGSDPLLISHWQQSLVEHLEIREQIEQILEDLEIEQTPAIPAMQPLVVDNKVIFRSFSGLRVVDQQNGNVLWETLDEVSPSMLLLGNQPEQREQNQFLNIPNAQFRMVVNGRVVNPYYGSQSGQHPISNFLFRNSVHGTFSSDGERVYLIDRNAILSNQIPGSYSRNFDPGQNDPYQRDWSSNRLVAYDLETGQQLWTAGGRKMYESIDPELAGTFFFGPPLLDDNELLLIGELENEIRIFALDPATGALRWSQLLAFSDTAVDQDLARRWWPAAVAISGGVIVCPTHVGFCIGIDRRSHEILWVSRYAKELTDQQLRMQLRGGGIVVSGTGQLNDAWFSTPPMIMGQTIIYAPPEQSILVAYRLSDGQELWKVEDFQQGLYPLGGHEDQCLIVCHDRLQAFHKSTGQELWSIAYSDFLADNDGQPHLPCGRGLIMNDQVLLPMNQTELWYFSLREKKFTHRAKVAGNSMRLGNLVMSQGQLVVASPLDVNYFQPKQEILAEIDHRLTEQPQNSWSLLKLAEIHLLEHEYQTALTHLHNIKAEELNAAEAVFYRELKRDALIGLVQQSPAEFDAEFEQYAQLIDSPADEQLYLRLLAERMLVRKDFATAFTAYAKLSEYDPQHMIRDFRDSNRTVRQGVWLRSRLQELWQISTGEVSGKITDSVRTAVAAATASGSLEQMRMVIEIYGFHPETEELYLEMVERAKETGDFIMADYALSSMARFDDPSLVATSLAERAVLLAELGLHEDSQFTIDRLNHFSGELVLLNGFTIQEWQTEFAETYAEKIAAAQFQTLNWAETEYEVKTIGTSSWSHQQGSVNRQASDIPYYQRHRFLFDQKTSRLEIIRRDTNQLIWSIPLQQMENVSHNNVLPIRVQGHLLIAYFRGIVQCYSLPDQQLVWSYQISSQPGVVNQLQAGKQPLLKSQQTRYAASRFRLNQYRNEFGPLLLTTPDTICYTTRNELVAIELATGQVRWSIRGVSRGATIYGDADTICVIPQNLQDAFLVRTNDGQKLESPQLTNLLEQGIAIHQGHAITISAGKSIGILGIQNGKQILAAQNLQTGDVAWEIPIDNDDYIVPVDERTIAVLAKSGSIQLIDPLTGRVTVTGQTNPKFISGARESFVFREQNRVYVVTNHSSNHSTYLNMYNQRLNGYIICIDSDTGTELWTHKTPSLNLVLDDREQMPVFIMAGVRHERKHNLYIGNFSIQVIDKQTGKVLLDDQFYSQNQVQYISWNDAKRQIKMHAYNLMFTLQPRP